MDHSNVTDSGKFDNPTFADWQGAATILGLRQRGLELVGPCPSCGGKDRFSVALKGNRTVFNCRQCQAFVEILKAAGFAGEPRRMNGTKHRAPPDMTHVYRDPKGEPYHRVYRRGSGPDKDVWQQAGFKGRFYPYQIEHLPDLGEGSIVIVEGEKCAEHLLSLGYTAMTWPLGADGVARTRWDVIAGYPVILWPDHDTSGKGQAAMRKLAGILEGLGCDLRIVEAPEGKPDHWDAADADDDEVHRLIAEAGEFNSSRPLEGDETDKLFPTMGEFLDMDLTPPEFLVDDTLPVGGLGILSAKPDVGKSTLLRTLAMAVATGVPWLGRRVKQGAVLLCQFEDIAAFGRDHLVTMGATRETPIFPFFASCPDEFIPHLSAWAKRHRPALIIIDTLGKVALGKDLLDYTVATEVLTPLVTLARTTDAAIMLSHHNKKGESYDPADDLLGSTAIRANMDHTLAITQTGETRTIKTVSKRYGEPIPATYLEIDPDTGRVEAAGTVKEKKGENMEAEIIAVLHDGPLTALDLEARITGKAERIRRTRDAMVERGDICREKVGRAHKYCLSVPSPS